MKRSLRYKKTRKMRKRMRGGNPALEESLFLIFRRSAQRAAAVIVEAATPAIRAASERAATGARVILTGARTAAERASTATRTVIESAATGARGLAGRAAIGARGLAGRAATAGREIAGRAATAGRNVAGRVGRFMARFGRRAPQVVRQAEGRATAAAANAAAPAARTLGQAITEFAGSLSQRASTWIATALPVLYAEGGAIATAIASTAGRTAGRSMAVNPQGWRAILGLVSRGVGHALGWAVRGIRGATPELAPAARPGATIVGRLIAASRGAAAEGAETLAGRAAQGAATAAERAAAEGANVLAGRAAQGAVGEALERAALGEAETLAARAARSIGTAISEAASSTGPLKPNVAAEFGQPQMLEYLTKNKVPLPRGTNLDIFKSAVRRPDKVLAQKKSFFEALMADGRMEGTPSEILESASKVLGDTEAARLFATEAPVAAAQKAISVAERAAIEAIPQGPRRADAIADLIAKNLEEAAAAEAEAIAKAAESGRPPAGMSIRRTNMMDAVMDRYNQLFGIKPSQLLAELRPTGTNVSRALQTGVSNAGIAEYAAWLRRSRQFFEGQVGPEGVRAFRRVLGPQRMVEFRQGMLRLFSHDPVVAEGIFQDFALEVVPRLARVSEGALGEFFSALRTNLPGAREALNALLTQLGRQSLTIATGTQRSLSTLPVRILGQVARGAVGSIVGLFVFVFQGTPSGTGLGEVLHRTAGTVRDGVFHWFGIMLWRDPPAPGGDFGRTLARIGGFNGDFAAMMGWIGGQARTWLWGIFTAIFISIGVSSQGIASRVIGFFRGAPEGAPVARVTEANPLTPPALRGPLTPTEVAEIRADNAGTATATTQGGYRRRTHRKYR